jgi:hypothetical protein
MVEGDGSAVIDPDQFSREITIRLDVGTALRNTSGKEGGSAATLSANNLGRIDLGQSDARSL